jgi:putative spermidine/putrescine transport system permease protein
VASSLRRNGASLGLAPFLLYVTLFLVIPTLVVVVNSVLVNGSFTSDAILALKEPVMLTITWHTVLLSLVTALIGAIVGSLVAYVLSTADPYGLLRRVVTSMCGVLAQFGGVTLAFAFTATVGPSGFLTGWLQQHTSINIGGSLWLFTLKGLILVYAYFQIPLMVIVFLPALDGVRPQWREAADTLGASTWQYWRHVAVPLLFPAFLGSTLLLFANAFAAYATAAALVNQGAPILALQIRKALSSEVLLGHQNLAYSIALEMIVIVAVVMFAYSRLQRRTSGWLR